jgi:hypothetical protein
MSTSPGGFLAFCLLQDKKAIRYVQELRFPRGVEQMKAYYKARPHRPSLILVAPIKLKSPSFISEGRALAHR